MRTANACGSVMSAVETNPTSMTVMIDDDCTSTVDTMPVPTPLIRCVVASDMNFRNPCPLTACRPSDRCFIPSKNTPNPPVTVTSTFKINKMFSFMCGDILP